LITSQPTGQPKLACFPVHKPTLKLGDNYSEINRGLIDHWSH
jgi:hypothetical protein